MEGQPEMPKANVNGINISYRVEGEGEPLIMISGAGANKGTWRSQTGAFKKYYRTITFDNRGVGESDKPAGPYTFKMMADDTIGLMDHLHVERAHVLGVSMGGMIAQEIALNHPERVNKLILACTFARNDETSGWTSEFDKAIEAFMRSSRGMSDQRRLANVIMDLQINKRSNRIFILPLIKVAIRFLPSRFLSTGPGIDAQFEAVGTHEYAADRLGVIKAPTLVITGAEDRLIKPTSSEVISSLVPRATLVKVPGGGHSIHVEMSGEFNREVLNFLKS